MALEPELLDLLLCPLSHAPLVLEGDALVSTDPKTRRSYKVEDDIPNMIVEESSTLDEGAWMEIMKRHKVVPGEGPSRG